MKLSISNIAWSSEYDTEMYTFLKEQKYGGLEIAPTRIFPDNPYERLAEASAFAEHLLKNYGLKISSMQSIWYGMTANIFGSDYDREVLIDYTKKAVLFASAMNCGNLVFGSPRNRNISDFSMISVAEKFFFDIGEFAASHGTVIAIEPNPPYYNTNFINTTKEAFSFVRSVGCEGLKVNVDLGTSIYCNDSIGFLNKNAALIHHVHISEPLLAPIEKRPFHRELKEMDYDGFFSIEMKNTGDLQLVKDTVAYIGGVL